MFTISLILGWMISGICSASINPNQSIHSYSESYPKMAIVISNIGAAKQYPSIMTGLNEKILTQSKSHYSLLATQEETTHFLEYLEDHDIQDPNVLKRKDIADFGKTYGYDYVAILNFNQIAQRDGKGKFIITWATNKTLTAEMSAKVVDTQTGSYIYRKDIVKDGTSTSIFPAFTGSNTSKVNAWLDIASLCTDEFIKDMENL